MDLVTEAVSESAKTKLAVYQALREAGFAGILTTNTSSLARATLLSGGVYDREKFALTHFFNPVLFTDGRGCERGHGNDELRYRGLVP